MSFRKIFRYPVNFLVGSVFLLTLWSYIQGEKFFLLIPLILFPLYSVQFSFFLPMIRLILDPSIANFKGVDLSSLRRFYKYAVLFEVGISIYLLVWALVHGKLVPVMIFYAFYAISCMVFFTFLFKSKFHKEAKKQNVDVKIKSFVSLLNSIRMHMNEECKGQAGNFVIKIKIK